MTAETEQDTQPNGDANVSNANQENNEKPGPLSQQPETAQDQNAKDDDEKLINKRKIEEKMKMVKPDKQPPGGYDSTPIPSAPPGYTVKFTFHRATNLPMADINSLSSDPFVMAQLKTNLPRRHKEDPPFMFRTPTIRRNTNPVWESVWIVGNVPASGFTLKARIYDEDPADHDDRLGNAHIVVDRIDENWPGIHEQSYKVKKRMGSKRAYLIRACAAMVQRDLDMSGEITMSVEVLGKTETDAPGAQLFTAGPNAWTRHFSPMLGRISGTKSASDDKPGTERYNFQAIQIQLSGPVPAKLYHRYVEFKPFIGSMFTTKGVRGWILNRALHHQHARVYNFDRTTVYGSFEKPCRDMTLQFLDLVHFDQGGRIFTYVLTLDGQLRFTETGKEFGIDLLSKHTMHSDVSIYIAFSGEFFIRRHQRKQSTSTDSPSQPNPNSNNPEDPTHPPKEISGGPPKDAPPRDPAYYELIIDNDSGTYRPHAELLPLLRAFLEHNLPGLRIRTLDCNGDKEKMDRLKTEQRERKKQEGDRHVYVQGSDSGSISSSDEELLDDFDATDGAGDSAAADAHAKHLRHLRHIKGENKKMNRNEDLGVGQSVKTVLHGPKERVDKFAHPDKSKRERIETMDDQAAQQAERAEGKQGEQAERAQPDSSEQAQSVQPGSAEQPAHAEEKHNASGTGQAPAINDDGDEKYTDAKEELPARQPSAQAGTSSA